MKADRGRFDMEIDRDLEERLNGAVCPEHCDDESLKDWILQNATESECDYCDREGVEPFAAQFGSLAEHVYRCVLMDYGGVDDEGIPFESAEGGYQVSVQDTWDILADEGAASDAKLLQDLAAAWHGQPWMRRGDWWLTDDQALAYGWSYFRRLVITERRYWFHLAARDEYEPSAVPPGALLPSIGSVIQEVGLTRSIDVGARLCRAQTHDPHEVLDTGTRLGPPPPGKAVSNRMSAAGISIFYGAEDRATAVAEVRHAEIDQRRSATTVGIFEALQVLRIVDLSNLPEVPRFFDSNAHLRPSLRFLRDFADDLSAEVTRDRLEHVDYVPTQVVAEWLRYEFAPGGKPVDGIAYKSARAQGTCVALFYGFESTVEPGSTPRANQPLGFLGATRLP